MFIVVSQFLYMPVTEGQHPVPFFVQLTRAGARVCWGVRLARRDGTGRADPPVGRVGRFPETGPTREGPSIVHFLPHCVSVSTLNWSHFRLPRNRSDHFSAV